MSTTQATDLEAIRQVVADAERLQSDPEGLAALHTGDTVIVNFGGRRVLGLPALRDAMAQALASPLADVTTTQQVDDVRFVHPDVALVSGTKFVHDGRESAARAGRPAFRDRGALTYVVVRTGDGWRIALAQTTPVAA